MKFKNLPNKVKRTPEQNAMAAFRAGSPINSLIIVLEDMTLDQMIDFFVHALKTTKFKTYRMGIENLEEAVRTFRLTHDNFLLTKVKRTFSGNDHFNSICTGILTLLGDATLKADPSWVSVIPAMIYEVSYGEDFGKQMISAILEFKYNNKNFGLLYAGN